MSDPHAVSNAVKEHADAKLEDLIQFDTSEALEAADRASVDIQIATAKKYPRSITDFQRVAEGLACQDEETAQSMYYRLPRAGKKLEGPSARFAEIVKWAWGNVRVTSTIAGISDNMVTVIGTCHDLERNVYNSSTVVRRITDKHGKRYSDDMIVVTCNAGASIARRNAIFQTVPHSYWMDILQKAKAVSLGKGKSLEERRKALVEHFAGIGVKDWQILKLLDKKGLEDITVDDLIDLRGLANAIKDGDTTVQEAFPRPGSDSEGAEVLNRLIDKHKPKEKEEFEGAPTCSRCAKPAGPNGLCFTHQEEEDARGE